MKRQAQAKLHAEYEARKADSGSYVPSLQWKVEHSQIAKPIRQRIARAAAGDRADREAGPAS